MNVEILDPNAILVLSRHLEILETDYNFDLNDHIYQ